MDAAAVPAFSMSRARICTIAPPFAAMPAIAWPLFPVQMTVIAVMSIAFH